MINSNARCHSVRWSGLQNHFCAGRAAVCANRTISLMIEPVTLMIVISLIADCGGRLASELKQKRWLDRGRW
jgi:hypothetical protein